MPALEDYAVSSARCFSYTSDCEPASASSKDQTGNCDASSGSSIGRATVAKLWVAGFKTGSETPDVTHHRFGISALKGTRQQDFLRLGSGDATRLPALGLRDAFRLRTVASVQD